MEFHKLKHAVAQQFKSMSAHELFRVDIDGDTLWETYLNSFPEGTNKIYRERREHDCSACRSFVKQMGNVVAIVNNEIVTIWGGEVKDPAYAEVMKAMDDLVRNRAIANRFLTTENVAGVDKNFEQIVDKVQTWEHFFVHVPKQYVVESKKIGPFLSIARSSFDVLKRSLAELTTDSIDTVMEIIGEGSLYRGEEHLFALKEFNKLKNKYEDLGSPELFIWSKLSELSGSVSRIRNTSIGTLLIDLSNGVELEEAVRKYEAIVAPSNYKRPKAIVTQAQVDQARKALEELGLVSALNRRYANIDDVSVNNLVFVDRNISPIKSEAEDVFSGIASKRGSKDLSKIEVMPIAKFLAEVVPSAKSIEVMFDGAQTGNLVSLVTAEDPTAPNLFKWNNPFSWSYNGDVADSIRERVKKAGGTVEGDLCCRLAWYSYDDLDFHMIEPDKYEIYFTNRGRLSPRGGKLDVDMNAGVGHTIEPVENIFYSSKNKMIDGTYHLRVHQYHKRDHDHPVGFEVEIDAEGVLFKFSYPQDVTNQQFIDVADIVYKSGKFEIKPKLPMSSLMKEVWGIKTNTFHRVRALMLSPNYWGDSGMGNKHYFFMLDGCRNDGQARGFYNEFLRSDLEAHRKTLEIVGSKIRTKEAVNQLSGLGFSSTKHTEVLVKVTSTFTRLLKVEV